MTTVTFGPVIRCGAHDMPLPCPVPRCPVGVTILDIPAPDPVNHPPHYGGEHNPYEAIKVIEAWGLGFCLGNAVKYICRAGRKGPSATEDLRKAVWYLERAIGGGV